VKKIHFYLLLISVLIFIFIYPLHCSSQKEEKLNYSEFWVSMDSADRVIFFMGVREGMLYSTLDIFTDAFASGLSDLSNTEKEIFSYYLWKKLSGLQENILVLIDIITSLYKYPENSYIRFSCMIDIAIKKLKGEPIEKLLEKRRKEAYENNSND